MDCTALSQHPADMPATPFKPSGYRALRKGRISNPDHVYLITTVTRDRHPHFLGFEQARAAILAFTSAEALGETRLLAWVLMPDHAHWLLRLGEDSPLSKVVNRMKARSACMSNRASHARGPLWSPGFHDRAMRRETDVRQAARYIIANPMRAGLVTRVGDYPFWDAVWL
jgi:putative transposase